MLKHAMPVARGPDGGEKISIGCPRGTVVVHSHASVYYQYFISPGPFHSLPAAWANGYKFIRILR